MEYTTLRFPSMKELWQFVKRANLRNYHFDTADCTLRASLVEDQIQIALTKLKAEVQARKSIA